MTKYKEVGRVYEKEPSPLGPIILIIVVLIIIGAMAG